MTSMMVSKSLLKLKEPSDLPLLLMALPREDLRPSGNTVLCLDAAMAGIGSNSCGPALRSRYRVDGHELGMELHLLLTTPDHIETHDEVTS